MEKTIKHRAEQAGLIAYPVNNIKVHQGYNGGFVDYDKNKEKRKFFVEGYKQAEEEMMKDEEALRKRVADALFMLTKTEELSVERVLEVAEQLTKGILS